MIKAIFVDTGRSLPHSKKQKNVTNNSIKIKPTPIVKDYIFIEDKKRV